MAAGSRYMAKRVWDPVRAGCWVSGPLRLDKGKRGWVWRYQIDPTPPDTRIYRTMVEAAEAAAKAYEAETDV